MQNLEEYKARNAAQSGHDFYSRDRKAMEVYKTEKESMRIHTEAFFPKIGNSSEPITGDGGGFQGFLVLIAAVLGTAYILGGAIPINSDKPVLNTILYGLAGIGAIASIMLVYKSFGDDEQPVKRAAKPHATPSKLNNELAPHLPGPEHHIVGPEVDDFKIRHSSSTSNEHSNFKYDITP